MPETRSPCWPTTRHRSGAESAGFLQAGTFTDDDGTEMTRYALELPKP